EQVGFEWSAVVGFTYNFINPYTQYRSGIDAHLDWAISPYLTEKLHIGAVGYVYNQVTGDSGASPVLGGFRSRRAGSGPQIGFFFPIGEGGGYLNLRGYSEFDAKNRLDQNQTDGDHQKARGPRSKPGATSKRISAHEQHSDGNGIGEAQRQSRVVDENERNDDRERRQEAEQADADRAEPVAFRQSRTPGLGQLEQSLPHQFQLVRLQDRRQHGWQRVRDDAMGVSDIGGRAQSPQLHGVAPPLVEASHQKHAGVDDSPGQVTAECGEEHGPNLDAVCGYDAEGQGEGKRHYQAQQDLRDPVHRLEDSIGWLGRKRRQRIDCRLDCFVFHLCRGRRCGSPLSISPPRLSSVAALSRPPDLFEVLPRRM